MLAEPPVNAQSIIFQTARSRILSALPALPVFAIRAPEKQQPPFCVLRLQDDVRGYKYVSSGFAAQTLLSVIIVDRTTDALWSSHIAIRSALHDYRAVIADTTPAGTIIFRWDRNLPLQFDDHYAGIVLYSVVYG